MSNNLVEQAQTRSGKLVQIIEDTVQILVDDYDLMQDDQYEEPSEINAEEIIYDVIKVLEDCTDPEVCLEMIVPVIGSLQKYMINLSEHANVFLVQLFLHLIQTCLTGIKGEFTLPKSIIKHIMDVVITKLPQQKTLIIEQAFLLGAIINNCTPDDQENLNQICQGFLLPLLKVQQSDDVIEALTGCITDISSTFKQEFQSQPELIKAIISNLSVTNISDKYGECLFNALGDITLSGGIDQKFLPNIIEVVRARFNKNNLGQNTRSSIVQMHTCLFNSLNETDIDLMKQLFGYVIELVEFVIQGIEQNQQISKQVLKDNLSLLLDIGVLYGKQDNFDELSERIWNKRTEDQFKRLKLQLVDEEDYKPLLYFESVLERIFRVDFKAL